MLQVVLLDALIHVVDLEGADQCGQPEYLGGEGHGGLVVEHALRVHQQHRELLCTCGLTMDSINNEAFLPLSFSFMRNKHDMLTKRL